MPEKTNINIRAAYSIFPYNKANNKKNTKKAKNNTVAKIRENFT